MNDVHLLQRARENLRLSKIYYETNKEYEKMRLGRIWLNNIERILGPLLDRDISSPVELASHLNDLWLFDVSITEPRLGPAIDWFLHLMQRHGIDFFSLPEQVQEPHFYKETAVQFRNGRRLSSNILWRTLKILRVIRNLRRPEGHVFSVELGSGNGSLGRLFKILLPQQTYIFIDIPESLFFAELFIKMAHPQSRSLYVHHGTSLSDDELREYDFVFLPTAHARAIYGNEIFLFLNTNSLGEMTNQVQSDWMRAVSTAMKPRYLFSLNRCLNRVDLIRDFHRIHCHATFFRFGPEWEVLDWEIDPDFERLPYATQQTRNLFLVAQRREMAAVTRLDRAQQSSNILDSVSLEDWNRKPFWDNYELKFGGEYPQLMSRGDRDLTPDLSTVGTLYKLWEAHRLWPTVRSTTMMRDYLVALGGTYPAFEEIYLLAQMLEQY